MAPINQTFVVESHEDLGDDSRQLRVHGESLATPVDGVAEAAHLARYRAAGLVLPVPNPLDKFFPAESVTVCVFGLEHALDHHLGGDARVIGAWLPQRVVPTHAMEADQCILDRVAESVAHVQRPGNVGRRNDDAVRGARSGRRKVIRLFPPFIVLLLELGGAVVPAHVRISRLRHHRGARAGAHRSFPAARGEASPKSARISRLPFPQTPCA